MMNYNSYVKSKISGRLYKITFFWPSPGYHQWQQEFRTNLNNLKALLIITTIAKDISMTQVILKKIK